MLRLIEAVFPIEIRLAGTDPFFHSLTGVNGAQFREWVREAQKFDEQDGQGPHVIGARIVQGVLRVNEGQCAVVPTHLDFLRTRVVERATCTLDPTAIRTELTEAKVDHHRSTSIVDEDVGSLEVFVTDTEQVEAVDGVAKPANEGDELGPGPGCADA